METELHQVMLYIDGSETAFRCECGCNVFHYVNDPERPDTKVYECNACGMWYSEHKDRNIRMRLK